MSAYLDVLASGDPLLTDGGIETRVMFESDYEMDPDLQVAAMLADPPGRELLGSIYSSYVRAGRDRRLPVVIGTPTFRASSNFAGRAGLGAAALAAINADAVALHCGIRDGLGHAPVFIAGVLGPSGDAYLPGEASNADTAAAYHRPQAEALAEAGADFLFAATFPAVDEAAGAGRAMAATGLLYVISFVLGPEGDVLDGTRLAAAVERLDSELPEQPATYSVSCVHPSVAARAMERTRAAGDDAVTRIGELKANGSPLPTDRLVELGHAEADPPEVLAEEIWALYEPTGLRVLGGCCGTTDAHMRALAALMAGAA